MEEPSFISIRKYCFFRRCLLAYVFFLKCSQSASHAGFGLSYKVIRWSCAGLIARARVKKVFSCRFLKSALFCSVAPALRVSVSSTNPHIPLAKSKCVIWNFHTGQFVPSSLLTDHLMSVSAMTNMKTTIYKST